MLASFCFYCINSTQQRFCIQLAFDKHFLDRLIDQLQGNKPSGMVHTCNPNTEETEAEGLQVPSQPGLHREALSLNK